jgi:hypothetical protein
MSNLADGRNSFDLTVGNSVVEFINRNSTPYPVEVGGPKFDLVPVTKQKDVMINVARMHAEQEYNRIMELVTVLQKQANDIRRRLELTDMVHSARYECQLYHGNVYWLVQDTRKNQMILTGTGPRDWFTGAPPNYQYIVAIKWLGDHTWMEVEK